MNYAMIWGALAGACCFYAGRLSTLVWQNKEIDRRLEGLKKAANELRDWAEEVKEKDELVRNEYQKVVICAANLHAHYNDDNEHWTEADDVFFSRWNSAE